VPVPEPEPLRTVAEGDSFEDYYGLLAALHAHLRPRVYLEIGVHEGHSFQLASDALIAIGVDPEPNLRFPLPRGGQLFRLTSDELFTKVDLATVTGGQPVDMAFIDGAHLFENALTDFANIERHCARGSTVLIHDCVPIDAVTSSRERTTVVWSGDVWKLVVCLRRYRPDLEVTTIDVPPTGLGIVTALDPTSSVLLDNFDAICTELVPLTYDDVADNLDSLLRPVQLGWTAIQGLLPAPYRDVGVSS
jgi:hypothetical protein